MTIHKNHRQVKCHFKVEESMLVGPSLLFYIREKLAIILMCIQASAGEHQKYVHVLWETKQYINQKSLTSDNYKLKSSQYIKKQALTMKKKSNIYRLHHTYNFQQWNIMFSFSGAISSCNPSMVIYKSSQRAFFPIQISNSWWDNYKWLMWYTKW